MIVLYFVFLIFLFSRVLTEDVSQTNQSSSSVTPASSNLTQIDNSAASNSKIQTVDASSNNAVTAVAPSSAVTQPNLDVRSPDVAPITSEVKDVVDKGASAVQPVPDASVPEQPVVVPADVAIVAPVIAAPDVVASAQPVVADSLVPASTDVVSVTISPTPDVATIAQPIAPVSDVAVPVVTQAATSAIDNSSTAPLATPDVSAQPIVPVSDVSAVTTSKPITSKIEEKPVAKKETQDVMSTINTLDVEEEGNWLLKRVWWEQAEQTFEKIIASNDDVIKLQIDYIAKRNELDKKLNELFRKLGFDQGEISEVLEYFLHQLSVTREAEGLQPSQREFFDLLNAKKEEIEKLRLDLNSLSELDISIDDVITQLVDQVNKSRDFEKSAWNDFKEIGRVLNDKKAKTLFYQIEADLKSIQNIQTYLSVELKKYYQDLLDNVDKTSNLIVNKINDLEKETGSFKEQFEKLHKEEEARKQNELENRLKSESEAKQPKPKKQKSWFGSLWDKITSIF